MATDTRWFWIAYAALGVGTLALLFGNTYLPLTDLPQHAVQLSVWVNYDDPTYRFSEQFELNWFTPYLLGYSLARPFVPFLGIVGALKAVIAIAVIATPLGLRELLRAVDRDVWPALLGFAFALGYCFYFGFLTYVLATPLLFVLLALVIRFMRGPSVRGAIGIAFFALGLFFCHGLIFATGLLLAGAITLVGGPSWRVRFMLLGAVLPSLIVAWVWSNKLITQNPDPNPEEWQLALSRVWDVPGCWLGLGRADVPATLGGFLMLALVVSAGAKPSRKLWRWVPLLVAVALYAFFPFKIRGVAFLYPRFAGLMLPLLLLALEDGGWRLRPKLWRGLAVLVTGGWIAFVAARFDAFNRQAAQFEPIVDMLPPGKRLRPIIFERKNEFVPGGAPFLHFPAYYQAEKGGYFGVSFATASTSFARYKPGKRFGMELAQEWRPETFSYPKEGKDYDFFVAASKRDFGPFLFRGAKDGEIVMVAQEGHWRLYTRRQTALEHFGPAGATPNRERP